MEKLNQSTPFNPTTTKEINSISLEHSEPLVEKVLGKHPTLSSNKNQAISDPGTISTTQLLHKPIVFENNLSWDVSAAANSLLYSISLLSIFEMLNISPGGQNLRGNAYFRSGARVELKLTSSPFHSGKLVFYYVPPGVRTDFRESIFAKVQYPCVYVDAANSTTGVLDIPFVVLKDFFATYNPDKFSDFGTINVAVFNPLRIGTGGPTSVQMALVLHPTQNEIALPVLAHDIKLESQGLQDALTQLAHGGNNLLDSRNPLELLQNLHLMDPGNDVGQLKDLLFNLVVPDKTGAPPSLPSIPTKISPQPDMPTKTSPPPNPNNTTTQTKVNTSAPSLANPSGTTTEHLSLIPEKTVVTAPDIEDMNLKRIAMMPSLLRTGTWSDSQNSGELLFIAPTDPQVVPAQPSSQTAPIIEYPTYLSHVIEPFAYWRGSLDYHFSFASTEQHKGKVMVGWIPNDRYTSTSTVLGQDPTLEQLSLYPNETFDLSLNKEFSFSVPYNAETPFRFIGDLRSEVRTDGTYDYRNSTTNRSTGVIYMMIFNKLSHPTTVSSTINFNVFVQAGKDFEFRALKFNDDVTSTFQRINYVTIQSLSMAYESTRDGIHKERVNRIGVSENFLSKTNFQDDGSEERLGILLQKYYPQFGFSTALTGGESTTLRLASTPGLNFRPPRSDDAMLYPDAKWRNLIAHYRDIFAFWHGSLNYFIIHNTTVNNPIILMVSHDPTDEDTSNILVQVGEASERTNGYYIPISRQTPTEANRTDLSSTMMYTHMSNLRVNPTIEITAPYRSLYRRLYCTDSRLSTTDSLDLTNTNGLLNILYSNPSSTDQDVSAIVFQSIGDDFQFKYIIPPPSLKSRN